MMNASIRLRRAFLAGVFVSSVGGLAGQIPAAKMESRAPGLNGRGPLGSASSAHRDGIFRIDVVVTDDAGKSVTGLESKDFTLLDNGQPARVFTFQSSSTSRANFEPLPELIFVFNEDNLPPEQSAGAEKVVAAYLRENRGLLAQPVLLYRVAHDGIHASVRPSTDGNALAEEAEKRREPRLLWRAGVKSPGRFPTGQAGPAAFRPVGVLGLIAIDQRRVPGRKMLVWFGDRSVVSAWRWCNFNEPVELSTRLREARIAVNVLLMDSGPDPIPDAGDLMSAAGKDRPQESVTLTLPTIATHTGGLVLASWDAKRGAISWDDVTRGIERCAAESRAFYSLTFDPPRTERPDEYHHLMVTMSSPGLSARAVSGYYNQPVYFDHPRPNLERLTVSQLEEAIRRDAGDTGFPRRMGNMELTQRLMNDKREQLLGLLRNDREREALMAVADLSEFLAPPFGDALTDPIPDPDAGMDILKRTFDYVAESTHKLPDFFATRTTIAYQEPQARDEDSCQVPSTEQPMRVSFTVRGTVMYRNGAEVVEAEKSSHKRLLNKRDHALDTHGTFGPVLAAVLSAAADRQSSLSWSHWEKSEWGKLAVFRFVVPFPIFEVTFCCVPEGDGATVYRTMTGYRGEFAVDPSSGAIMRVAVEADLDEDRDPHAPLIRSAVLIDYAPVEIGGRRYISPVRSVSLSRGRTRKIMYDWGIPFIVYGAFEMLVNDFAFSDYHKFGSESRILSGVEEQTETNAPPKEKHH